MNKLKLSEDGVFHTIQGEGKNIGESATFVRLNECNLNCSWCDTPYTWNRENPSYRNSTIIETQQLRQLIQEEQKAKNVEKPCHRVVFTGGEPLLQQKSIAEFIDENEDLEVEIETNGTIRLEELRSRLIQFNCSPKLQNSGIRKEIRYRPASIQSINQEPNSSFKFVCEDKGDIDEMERDFIDTKLIVPEKVIIIPEGITTEANYENYQKLNETIIRKGYRTLPRLHNLMFGGAKRRV